MKLKKQLYADIAKVEDQEDGTIKVWGFASSGSVDADGETITPEAMKAALPDYMKFGAVREMHQPLAAGTAIEASVGEDGKTWFGAHIVDPVAITKVQTKVYKGFSIGGKVTERDTMNKSIIKGLNLVEVSLVDRPCNPDAVMTVFKVEGTPEDDVNELAELLDNGTVTPAEVLALVKASKEAKPADTVIEPAPEDVSKMDTPTGDTVQKGMYTVSAFAQTLSSLAYLCEDVTWEAEYEGDNSPLPQALKDWVATGIGLFTAMAQEEAQELAATLQNAVAKGTATTPLQKRLQNAQTDTDGIAKAGAKYSKTTKATLANLEKAIGEACDHLKALGYQDAEEDEEDGTSKAATVDNGSTSEDAISKALAPINEQLQKVQKENEDLNKKLEALGKQAAPGRALLKVLSKGQDALPDVTNQAEQVEAPPEGTPARAEFELRKVFQAGGTTVIK